jgi:hypothetical protein
VLPVPLDDLRTAFGLGVAGNFAGHLEQAGEAGDFVGVTAASPDAPKGIFPFWVPGADTFLGVFPLSSDTVALPASDEPLDLQIEPEVGLLCRATYADDGAVERLAPLAVGAFNDCSVRRPGARKISEKKNWGPASKGVSTGFLAAEDLSREGPTAALRLASYLRRDGVAHAYGIDSPVAGYSYYGATLLEWLVDRLNHQPGAEDTPLEDVGALLRDAGRPDTLLVGIGATRYTEYGASTYLEPGDEAVVVVYDARGTSPEDVARAVAAGREDDLEDASVLVQRVVAAG